MFVSEKKNMSRIEGRYVDPVRSECFSYRYPMIPGLTGGFVDLTPRPTRTGAAQTRDVMNSNDWQLHKNGEIPHLIRDRIHEINS
ncbi:hypothetical protein RRG08_026230 [Elysia crispata]|uniref:Uncharacterized protein n=1 Tax=Elysia crispata TaxID=231223 RepID=A0AAE0ZAG6_9GAST|nr:hypothetical protein RRG08_026230 [Elysia crispata]